MTENKDRQNEKEKEKEKEKEREHERELEREENEREKDKESPQDRNKVFSHFVDAVGLKPRDRRMSTFSEELRATLYKIACVSFQTEIMTLDVGTGDLEEDRKSPTDDSVGMQRVYKKTSPNCVLTLYLPTREIILSGSSPSLLRGIVYVDPKAIQGYRVYAQLTLTFRYGREDEEVMGLRFCNEAIMSLHQIFPRNEEPARESLSPLQDALIKRLGEGAHPFTLSLISQAPPSVQLVPAKRYYGAPIGTSYDVRCFIADKTDEKFHRRASVKMGVRVIYRSDVVTEFGGPENFTAATTHNNQISSPPIQQQQQQQDEVSSSPLPTLPPSSSSSLSSPAAATTNQPQSSHQSIQQQQQQQQQKLTTINTLASGVATVKQRKSERGESFPKLRLSPKSFRFSGRFGRSKSEIEKCPNDPFYNYSKSFQEYDSCGGPQGAVDKPFLLQDGRVGLRAHLDKAWYTHGEDVCVTVNIRNDSRKTVRKVRVCAIQHVDVCMFNNGKFKNVVADSDCNSPPVDRTVLPGGTLSTTFVLKPQRGQTKNWIALEDTLQRSTEPEEITGSIAASAIRSPSVTCPLSSASGNPNSPNLVSLMLHQQQQQQQQHQPLHLHSRPEDRNVFAIYVSYYVKVKLTLSGMGGELSLKLPFALVHVDESARTRKQQLQQQQQQTLDSSNRISLDNVPNRKLMTTGAAGGSTDSRLQSHHHHHHHHQHPSNHHLQLEPSYLDRIESIEDEDSGTPKHRFDTTITPSSTNSIKRKLIRSETIAKDGSDDDLDECNASNENDSKISQGIIHHEEVNEIETNDKVEESSSSSFHRNSIEQSNENGSDPHQQIITNAQVHSDL